MEKTGERGGPRISAGYSSKYGKKTPSKALRSQQARRVAPSGRCSRGQGDASLRPRFHKDPDAKRAGLKKWWSDVPVEGCGRSNFDLSRIRTLAARKLSERPKDGNEAVHPNIGRPPKILRWSDHYTSSLSPSRLGRVGVRCHPAVWVRTVPASGPRSRPRVRRRVVSRYASGRPVSHFPGERWWKKQRRCLPRGPLSRALARTDVA